MTEPMIIRWGISGTGNIARQFADDIQRTKGAALAAVCSRDLARAKAFADRHSGTTGFGSLSKMLASGSIDAVYLATPNSAHRAQALDCIAAGMPVLIEKPMTTSLEEALEIRSAARESRSLVMEAMWSRYLPAVGAARAALRDGVIGTVRRLEAEIAWKQDYDPQSRFFDKAQGGGALHDIGVYPISLTRFLLGTPDTVTASWRAAPSGVDISADIQMRFGSAEAHLSCGFDRNGSNRMLIEGDRGVLVLGSLFIKAGGFAVYPSRRLADLAQPGGNTLPARIRRKLLGRLPLPGTSRHDFGFEGNGLQFEIEAASRAILQRLTEEPGNTLDDSIATLRIIDNILARPPVAG